MSHNTIEDELLEFHEDPKTSDADEKTCDSSEVDDSDILQMAATSRPVPTRIR